MGVPQGSFLYVYHRFSIVLNATCCTPHRSSATTTYSIFPIRLMDSTAGATTPCVPRLDPVRLSRHRDEPRHVIFIQRHLPTSRLGPTVTVPAQGVPDIVALQHQCEAVHSDADDLRDPGGVPDSAEVKNLHPIAGHRQLPKELLDAPSCVRMPSLARSAATISIRGAGQIQMMPKEQVSAVVPASEWSILPSADWRRINPARPADCAP